MEVGLNGGNGQTVAWHVGEVSCHANGIVIIQRRLPVEDFARDPLKMLNRVTLQRYVLVSFSLIYAYWTKTNKGVHITYITLTNQKKTTCNEVVFLGLHDEFSTEPIVNNLLLTFRMLLPDSLLVCALSAWRLDIGKGQLKRTLYRLLLGKIHS